MADKYLQHPDLLELVRCAVEQEEEAKFKLAMTQVGVAFFRLPQLPLLFSFVTL
jgi:hypothetical protein